MNKTKELILNSFIELINDDNFEKVTITDLVAKNKVSRQTFYYHFDDIEDLLRWSFDESLKEMYAQISKTESFIELSSDCMDFIKKYVNLIIKSSKSQRMLFVYNLIYSYFERLAREYLIRKAKIGDYQIYDYLIDTWAHTLAAKIIKEALKESPDFDSMYEEYMRRVKKVYDFVSEED